MTNQQVINFLGQARKILLTDKSWLESSVQPISEAFDVAIEALKAKPCEDAISRQAAIDAIGKIFPADPMKNDYTQGITCGAALATEYIKQLPPTQSEQRWIPCSERLPDYFEPVNTWDGHCYSVEKRIPYIRDEDGDQIKAEWWVSDDYDEEETDYYPNLRDGAAIAWMPLPEPMKEVNDE